MKLEKKNPNKIYFFANEAGANKLFDLLQNLFSVRGYEVTRFSKKDMDIILTNENHQNDIWFIAYDLWEGIDQLILHLKKKSILTFGILDAWKGLYRFWKTDLTEKRLTDYLFVFDKALKVFLESKNLKSKLLVVQNPMFEMFMSVNQIKRSELKNKIGKKLNLDKAKKNLFLISEPLFFRENNNPYKYIYSKNISENEDLIHNIEKKYKDEYNLILRQHPLENPVKKKLWYCGTNLTEKEALFSGDFFVGVGSTFLILAHLVGFKIKLFDNLINWKPIQSNYDEEIWKHIETNLINNKIFNSVSYFLTDKKIIDYVLLISKKRI